MSPSTSSPTAPRSDASALLTSLGRRIPVAMGALAALLALIAGAPVHVASGRGLAGWFLTLALLSGVRRVATWSVPAAGAERSARPPKAAKP